MSGSHAAPGRGPEPVRLYTAVMAGWQVVLAGAAFADLMPLKMYGLIALVTAGVQAGWGEWTRGQVTPSSQVVAAQKPGEPVKAGPKAENTWGMVQGTTVTVDPVE